MGKKKGKKKSKKSKEQLEEERLAKEEEQRLALEAELKRQEEERIKREEEERIRKETEARLRKEELSQLNDEISSSSERVQSHERARDRILKEKEGKRKWDLYLDCRRTPDAGSEAELNTFLGMWLEDTEHDLEKVMNVCQETEIVVDELGRIINSARGNNDPARAEKYQHYLKLLRDAELRKLDFATAYILQNAGDFANAKREVLMGHSTDDIKLGVWVNLASKGFRMKTIDFPNVGIIAEVPKTLALESIAVRVIHTSYDNITSSAANTDMSLGGVVSLEILKLPQPSKCTKGWAMTLVSDLIDDVKRLGYPLGRDGMAAPASAAEPLGLKITLPPYVVVRGQVPRVGWWDESRGEKGGWNEEDISELNYDPVTRLLSFRAVHLTAMSVLQSKRLDLPYSDWSLTPTSNHSADYMIQGPRFKLVISIDSDLCTLKSPVEDELSHLLGCPMQVGELLDQLEKCGINIRPTKEEERALSGVEAKDNDLETKLHREITTVCHRHTLSASKWNQAQGTGRATCQVAAPSSDERATLLFQLDNEIGPGFKCAVIETGDEADEFSTEIKDGHRSCCYIHNALGGSLDDEAESTLNFQDTVYTILNLTRPFSFQT